MEKKYVYTIQRDSAEKIGKLKNDLKKVLEKDKVDTHDLLMNEKKEVDNVFSIIISYNQRKDKCIV